MIDTAGKSKYRWTRHSSPDCIDPDIRKKERKLKDGSPPPGSLRTQALKERALKSHADKKALTGNEQSF